MPPSMPPGGVTGKRILFLLALPPSPLFPFPPMGGRRKKEKKERREGEGEEVYTREMEENGELGGLLSPLFLCPKK